MDNTWYCDSHAHYDQRRFRDDQAALLGAMEDHNIRLIVNVGCDLPSSLASIALAERYDFIYASVGSHPDDADHVDEGLISLYRQLSQKEKVVASGVTPRLRAMPESRGAMEDMAAMGVSRKLTRIPKMNTMARKP